MITRIRKNRPPARGAFRRAGARARLLAAAAALGVLAGPASFGARAGESRPAPLPRACRQFDALPLSFEPNEGQTDSRVKYLARGPGYVLFLGPRRATLKLNGPVEPARGVGPAKSHAASEVISLQFVGANSGAAINGSGDLPGVSNYFIGSDPRKWRAGVAHYAKVAYTGVYPGIDMVFYGSEKRLEYNLVLAPGADARQARFRVEGARSVDSDAAGDLVLRTAAGSVTLQRPAAYQAERGARRPVAVRFRSWGRNEFGFAIGARVRSLPLTIDPVLVYSTYLGGNGGDAAYGIAVDAAGEAYVAGETASANFPVKSGAQTAPGGDGDAFISKLDAAGSGLVYSTYLGGSGADSAAAIAIDSSGSAYVTGSTSSPDFPVTAKVFQSVFGGSSDAFVAKLSPDGSTLTYASFFGGAAADFGQAIAIDGSGNAYVTGSTQSFNFPVVNPIQIGNDDCSTVNDVEVCSADAFVAKVNTTASALLYSTYLGGSAIDSGQAIAVDAHGDAYVAGYTYSGDFPTQSALQSLSGGGIDAFVSKLDPGGASLLFSTYLGGSGQDQVFGLALDAAGNLYLAGDTSSSNFPTTSGVFQTAYGGGGDAFLTKMSGDGSALLYSTLVGGAGMDQANGVAVDGQGNAVIAGVTESTDFPVFDSLQRIIGVSGAGSCGSGICSDAFVTAIDPTGGVIYSTYLGGTGADFAQAVADDASGVPYVAGVTSSANFPAVAGALQGAYAGEGTSGNAFVAKVETLDAPGVALSPQALNFGNQTLNVASAPQSVTLVNAGSAPLQIDGISAAGDFAESTNCGNTLPAGGGTCNIAVTYTPTTAGPNTGQVTITDNGSGSPHHITVTGNGVTGGGGTLTVTPSSLVFPSQAIGTNSTTQSVLLVNGSLSSVTLSDITISGDFAETNDCGALPAVLNPDASCSILVTFTPTSSGSRTGSLSVTDNAAGSPQKVSLTGTSPGPFTLSASAHSSTIVEGTDSTTFTVSVSAASGFTSSITFTCASTVTCSFDPSSVTAGQSTTVTVKGLSSATANPLNLSVTAMGGKDTASIALSIFFEDFSVAAVPALRSVNAGESTTYNVTISPINGFNQVVLLACRSSLLPQGVTCSWSPSSGVTLNGSSPATATVTVSTTTQQSTRGGARRRRHGPPGGGLTVLARALAAAASLTLLAALLAMRRKARPGAGRVAAALAGALLLAAASIGCQTYGYNVIGAPTIVGTPTGSYVITISGTLGSDENVKRTATVNLTVAPG